MLSHLSCIMSDSKVVHSNTWLHIERVFLQREEQKQFYYLFQRPGWTVSRTLMWSRGGRTECWLCSFSSKVSSVALGKWLSSFISARRPSFYGNMDNHHHKHHHHHLVLSSLTPVVIITPVSALHFSQGSYAFFKVKFKHFSNTFKGHFQDFPAPYCWGKIRIYRNI